jgi:hypothetical protein
MQESPIQDFVGNPPGDTRWDALIEWSRLFYQWDRFQEAERDYKLEIAQTLASVRDMLLDGFPNWDAGLKGPRSPGYHLINWRVYSAFRNLLDKDKALVGNVLKEFWQPLRNIMAEERIRQFEERIAVGPNGQLAAAFLMADDPTNNPPYRAEYLNRAYQSVGRERDEVGDDGGRRYRRMLNFLDEFIRRSAARSLHIRDRMDAQSLLWCVMLYGTERPPASEWPEGLRLRYDAYLHGDTVPPPLLPLEPVPELGPEPEPLVPADPWSQEKLAALADELLWDENELAEMVADLREKRQVIFYGPSGTGKTYVARRIAQHCRDEGGDFAIVQFHPSYSYEDFVEGFRPRLHDGQPGFDLVAGPLLRIAAQAAANPRSTYILVIDELNRGNVAKIFGELYYLLEYRDDEIQLQYSGGGQRFRLPENLWFICTMNTADRSIALMDSALRRRFYFTPFFGDQPPIQGLLRRWLERNRPDMAWAADLVDLANERLGDRHMSIGPSYFMNNAGELDEVRVRRTWRRAVIPYIEEQFFGNEDRLAEFDFDRLLSELPQETRALTDADAGEGLAESDERVASPRTKEIPTSPAQGEGAPAADANTPVA